MTSLISKLPSGRIIASGITALALIGSLATRAEAQQPKLEVLKGIPSTPSENCSGVLRRQYTGVSVGVKVGDKYVLATYESMDNKECTEAAALIKLVEKIGGKLEMHGSYGKGGIFEVQQLGAYGINLKKTK